MPPFPPKSPVQSQNPKEKTKQEDERGVSLAFKGNVKQCTVSAITNQTQSYRNSDLSMPVYRENIIIIFEGAKLTEYIWSFKYLIGNELCTKFFLQTQTCISEKHFRKMVTRPFVAELLNDGFPKKMCAISTEDFFGQSSSQ